MLYFYCGEIIFHSDDLLVGDVSIWVSGSVKYSKKIETLEDFDFCYEDLKKNIFSRTIKKDYPSASLSNCDFYLSALNPL